MYRFVFLLLLVWYIVLLILFYTTVDCRDNIEKKSAEIKISDHNTC